ncbi:MAG: hypothetical protein ACYTJ0_05560, partial [Planctomycetota bacterium]
MVRRLIMLATSLSLALAVSPASGQTVRASSDNRSGSVSADVPNEQDPVQDEYQSDPAFQTISELQLQVSDSLPDTGPNASAVLVTSSSYLDLDPDSLLISGLSMASNSVTQVNASEAAALGGEALSTDTIAMGFVVEGLEAGQSITVQLSGSAVIAFGPLSSSSVSLTGPGVSVTINAPSAAFDETIEITQNGEYVLTGTSVAEAFLPEGFTGFSQGSARFDATLTILGGPIGACCLPDFCKEGSELECSAAGGVFQGEGTTCAETMCPVLVGACCFLDGSCTDGLTETECSESDGEFQGAGTDCDTTECPVAGACCFADGTCSDGLTEAECTKSGGAFQGGGSDCETTMCPVLVGACCFDDGSCTDDQLEADCTAAGGAFQGGGSGCETAMCPVLVGACCFNDGSCTDDQLEADCTAAGGAFQGGGSGCETA